MKYELSIRRSIHFILSLTTLLICSFAATPSQHEGPSFYWDKESALLIDKSSPSPTPNPGVITQTDLQQWHRLVVGTKKPEFTPLTLTIPETPPDTLFTWGYLNQIAQDNVPGVSGHLTDEQRLALKQFLEGAKHDSSTMVYINGDDLYEGHDLLAQAGIVEAEHNCAIQWVRNAVHLEEEVKTLNTFQWKPGGALPGKDAPAGLKAFLRAEFQRMKNTLTSQQQARLVGWMVEFERPPAPSLAGESLWLKTTGNVVWVSPLMLRTLLLEAAETALILDYPVLLTTTEDTGTPYEQLGKPAVANSVIARVQNDLDFAL